MYLELLAAVFLLCFKLLGENTGMEYYHAIVEPRLLTPSTYGNLMMIYEVQTRTRKEQRLLSIKKKFFVSLLVLFIVFSSRNSH